jgi:hypothetical protein
MIGPVAMIPSCFYLPTAEGEYGLDLVALKRAVTFSRAGEAAQ